MPRTEIFSSIYSNGIWNNKNSHIPLSGPGSSIAITTSIRTYLDTFCEENDIESLVDIGCGDLTWMPMTRIFASRKYTGLDIVPSLIENHCIKYPQHTFTVCDVITDDIPHGDVAIIRDITFHMKHEELAVFLKKIVGKFRFYFITSCNNTINNPLLDIYHYHKVNLFAPPFSFKNYQETIAEPMFDRSIVLFTAEQYNSNF